MSADLIHIEDLELRTRIGISATERARSQRVLCTLTITTDFSRAARTDNIADTINAQQVAHRIRRLAAARPRHLVERLAEEIAACVLSEFNVKRVAVTLQKFVLPRAKSYGVHLSRARKR